VSDVQKAAETLRSLADKIVRQAERVESCQSVLNWETQELERLKKEHAKAKEALIEAAQGNPFACIPGYVE
jgi:hypothetical protein